MASLALSLLTLSAACGAEEAKTSKTAADAVEEPAADVQFDVPSPLPSLGAVWGSGPDDVWAVGANGVILHFDGIGWTAAESPTRSALFGVHGTGPDDVWAVGDQVILHWDGDSWSIILEHVHESLLAVWSAAPDDVWIAGIDKETHHGLLRHWDGQGFIGNVFKNAASVWEIWGAAPDDVWVAGANLDNEGFIARGNVDGVGPADVKIPGGPLRGLWGQGASDIWFMPYQGPLQHWDGESYTSHDFEGMEGTKLLGIFGTSEDDVWAVGLRGAVLHFDGEIWSRIDSPIEATLWAVWASGPDDAWAVGGTLMHWNGDHWRDFGEAMSAVMPAVHSPSH